MALQIK